MKLLIENWKTYINEIEKKDFDKVYYWQTSGPYRGQVEFGVTHVPKAIPRQSGNVEEIFEAVRKEFYPERPSRYDCVFLCENLEGFSGRSFCRFPAKDDGETYEVKLQGDFKVFRANAEYFTEAVFRKDMAEEYAHEYWKGKESNITFLEVLVSPPQSAIITNIHKRLS